MDTPTLEKLAHLIAGQRIGALGTLREGAPFVSMIPFVPSRDFSRFFIHASRLAYHTQDFLNDPRVSLLITETDRSAVGPQTLARLTVRGSITAVNEGDAEYETARELYLKRFPDSAMTFGLGDFALYGIRPETARFVAGFGRTFTCSVEDLKRASVHTLPE